MWGILPDQIPYAKILNRHRDDISLKDHEALTRVKIICEAFPLLSYFRIFAPRISQQQQQSGRYTSDLQDSAGCAG